MTTYNWLTLAVIAGLCVLGAQTAPAEEIDSRILVATERSLEFDLEDRVLPAHGQQDRWRHRNPKPDRLGDRINRRLDRKADRAIKQGRPLLADRLDRRGDRIDRRLDRRGDRLRLRIGRRIDRHPPRPAPRRLGGFRTGGHRERS